MDKKEKRFHARKRTRPFTLLVSEPESLKDNPDGATICHADFSDGCVNEDTDPPVTSQEGDENENH